MDVLTVLQLLFYYSIIKAPKRPKVTAAEGLGFLSCCFFFFFFVPVMSLDLKMFGIGFVDWKQPTVKTVIT